MNIKWRIIPSDSGSGRDLEIYDGDIEPTRFEDWRTVYTLEEDDHIPNILGEDESWFIRDNGSLVYYGVTPYSACGTFLAARDELHAFQLLTAFLKLKDRPRLIRTRKKTV